MRHNLNSLKQLCLIYLLHTRYYFLIIYLHHLSSFPFFIFSLSFITFLYIFSYVFNLHSEVKKVFLPLFKLRESSLSRQ